MKRATCRGWLLVLVIAGWFGHAYAAPTARQTRQAKLVEAALKKATNLAKAKKVKDAAQAFKQAQAAYEELLGGGDEGARLAQPLFKQLQPLHDELELQGVKLMPLPEPADADDKNGAPLPAAAAGAGHKEYGPFALEIGPVLIDQCLGCHGGGDRPAAKFDLSTFQGLLKGGESGAAIAPGAGAGSLLVKKLRGTAPDGDQMPKDRAPLSDDVIAKFEKWISAGAKPDGLDVDRPLNEAVAEAHAEHLTAEELTKERAELAAHNWKLILPTTAANQATTANFLIMGDVGKEQLKEVGAIAEAEGAKLQKLLRLPAGPLLKGRATIYVFDKRFEYGELGQMLEHRELPRAARSHWEYTVVDAYLCLLPAKNDEYPLSTLIGKELAALLVASQGGVPRWFAEGAGRNLAIKLDPKDARYREWEDDSAELLKAGFKPATIRTARGPDCDLVSYRFVKPLLADSAKYRGVLAAVRAQTPFDSAFATAYGATPEKMLAAWKGAGN